jgi:hypothetical protein
MGGPPAEAPKPASTAPATVNVSAPVAIKAPPRTLHVPDKYPHSHNYCDGSFIKTLLSKERCAHVSVAAFVASFNVSDQTERFVRIAECENGRVAFFVDSNSFERVGEQLYHEFAQDHLFPCTSRSHLSLILSKILSFPDLIRIL